MQVATVAEDHDWLSKTTFCVLPCRKSSIHARTIPAVPQCETLSSRCWCGTLSKALENSSSHVHLTFIIQAFGKVTNSEQEELCFTRPLFPEFMLSIC